MRFSKLSEHQIQSDYFIWVRIMRNADWRYNLVFAIPNGAALPTTIKTDKRGKTYKDSAARRKLTEEGMTPGVHDVFVSIPAQVFDSRSGFSDGSVVTKHGMYLEFKNEDGKQSPEQLAFGTLAQKAGYHTTEVRSWEVAKKYTEAWMDAAIV